jgi:hypothetical protein
MSPKTRVSIAPSHLIERVGNDVVVLLPEPQEVVKFSGALADLLYSASISGSVEVPEGTDPSELIERGIVVLDSEPSRRTILKVGAVGAGASVVALGLPSVAAASSIIQLTGTWYYFIIEEESGRILVFQDFEITGVSFPTTGTPSGLTVNGETIPLPGGPGVFSGGSNGSVLWFRQLDPAPDPVPITGLPIIGTFTWAGISYAVTFNFENRLEVEP